MPRRRHKFSKFCSALKSFIGTVYRLCRFNLFWCFCCTCFDGLRKLSKIILHGFTTYFQRGYITGTRYLVQPNYHFTERIFWALCLVSSFVLCAALIMRYLSTFSTDVYRIGLEKRDINLPIQFPSIGVCEYRSDINEVYLNELTENISKRYSFKTRRGSFNINNILNFMTFQERHHVGNSLTSYIKNAKNESGLYKKMFDDIDFESLADKVYLMHPNDIPETITPLLPLRHHLIQTSYKNVEFSLQPIITDRELYAYNRNMTNCFKGNEKYLDWNQLLVSTYKHVSFTTCLTDCIRYLQFKECGCINYNFYQSSKVNYCDLKGYMCLEEKGLFYLRSLVTLKHTICGQCDPACDSAFIDVTFTQSDFILNGNPTITFKLQTYPTNQLHRQVIRGNLDILVSLGGIFSLFLGSSLVSLMEFIFIVIRAML